LEKKKEGEKGSVAALPKPLGKEIKKKKEGEKMEEHNELLTSTTITSPNVPTIF